ncbi:MAG: beta-lactamase family protein [Oscillospiraceae bacterium]|jgi:CubicO group peptidase (beta-lactamase class C family)|nr:beta-lactamase family protein [Oscillospiraceae bacterium]
MNIIQGRTDCAPADVGYDASRLGAVNGFFTRMIEQNVIHGVSYRLARRGKVFAVAALGGRHYKNPGVPMQPDAGFHIASQTKAFTAVAIQILVEDGLVSVEDRAAQYLPQFDGAPYDGITLFHLLTHTSGLYPEGSIPDKHHIGAFDHIDRQSETDGKSTDWIAAGLRSGLRRPPGTEWQYCSFGIMVLGAIMETVTGVRAEEFIINRICKPLGMDGTTFAPTPDMARSAVIFNEGNEKRLGGIERGDPIDDGIWDVMPGVSGSLFSNTADLVRFGSMLSQWGRLGDARILGRKAVESLATQRLFNIPDRCWGSAENDRKYGLGVDMRRFPGSLTSPGTYFHEGAGHSVLIVDPAEEMVCSCVYPWVGGEWNADCNGRLYNVMWSGLI